MIDIYRFKKISLKVYYKKEHLDYSAHQRLSTYNIGLECSKKQWLKLSRQFINKGLLIQDADFVGLKLTEKVWKVLKGKKLVMGRLVEENTRGLHPDNDNIQCVLKSFGQQPIKI